MYLGKKVSIVFPVYNEKENIKNAIEEFLHHPAVDEIIAVDNNSKDGTAEEIKRTSARYFLETTQGYGAALKRGMREATGDLIVTVEPDGTFRAEDLDRLLVYSRDYEVVFGTRTSRSPVWSGGDPGANMDFFMRMGNWGVAKLLEYLFNGPSLTDVGCSYKLIHRHAYEKVKDTFTVDGNWFSPEYMVRILQHGLSVVEIPVRYGARIGTSKITGKRHKAIALGIKMAGFIIAQRIKSWSRPLLLLLVSVLLLTAIPFLEIAFIIGPSWTGILPGFTDELNFARITTIGEGHFTAGNAYFLEHSDGPSLVMFGGAWLNAIPLLLGIPLLPALFINFVFWSLAFALLALVLLRELRAPPWIAAIGTLLLYIQSYEHVWRPINLQPVYPFYFLFYLALLRFIKDQKQTNIWLLAIATASMFYLFAYMWQIAAITLGLLFLYALVRKEWVLAQKTLITSCLGGALGLPVLLYMLWLSHASPYFWESIGRLGLVDTHLPMAEIVYSGGWIGVLLLVLGILVVRLPSTREHQKNISLVLFLVVSGLGLWIMQGSNIITGKLLETGEHIRLLIAPWLLFATITAALLFWRQWSTLSKLRQALGIILLSVLAVVNVYYTYQYLKHFMPDQSIQAGWIAQQDYAGPFNWLTAHESKSVVVWSNPHDPLSANLPIYTRHFTLYAYWGMLELVPEKEVRERYLVSEYFANPTVEDLKGDAEMSLYLGRHDYPHAAKTIERQVKLCRIVFFWDSSKDCGIVPTPQSLLGDAFFNDLENTLQHDIKPNIKEYLKKYHVSYILKDKELDKNYDPVALGGVLVFSDARYELYSLK